MRYPSPRSKPHLDFDPRACRRRWPSPAVLLAVAAGGLVLLHLASTKRGDAPPPAAPHRRRRSCTCEPHSQPDAGLVGRWGKECCDFSYGRFSAAWYATEQMNAAAAPEAAAEAPSGAAPFYSAVASSAVRSDPFVWLHYAGDSLLRGVFLHAAERLVGARATVSNATNYHNDRVLCCSTATSCVFEIIEPDAGVTVWGFVDRFAPPPRPSPKSPVPRFCISFSWTPRWVEVETQLDRADASKSVRWPPHTLVVNPALHEVFAGAGTGHGTGERYDLGDLDDVAWRVLERVALWRGNGSDTHVVVHAGTATEEEFLQAGAKRENMALPAVVRYNGGLRRALDDRVVALRAHEWCWFFDAFALTSDKTRVGATKDGMHYTQGRYGAIALDADLHIGFGGGRGWVPDEGR